MKWELVHNLWEIMGIVRSEPLVYWKGNNWQARIWLALRQYQDKESNSFNSFMVAELSMKPLNLISKLLWVRCLKNTISMKNWSSYLIIFGIFSFYWVWIFRAHKSSLIVDIVKEYPRVNLLLTPANTPEFSPIENLFGYVKRTLADFEFEKGIKGK